MNKTNRLHIASSLVLLAFLFGSHCTFAQIPKLFLKFAEKQNKVKSGYIKLQRIDIIGNDTLIICAQEGFFISTHKDLKYLAYNHRSKYPPLTTACKSAYAIVYIDSDHKNVAYRYDDEIYDATTMNDLLYSTANGIFFDNWEDRVFQRIPPKIDKKNIRYKILFPDQEQDQFTNITQEWEFNGKTFHLIQEEFSLTYFKTDQIYHRIDILDRQLYEYIHPDILDTVSFKFEEIKKGYDRQATMEQTKRDSIFKANFCDSIAQSVTRSGDLWTENTSQEVQKDTLFFMPDWKFPLLSGDSIYSNSINSRFLLIDMWYVSCHPCRLAMYELSSIETLYDESLLKIVSLNVIDKDTAKMSHVVKNLNLKCDVACAYNNGYDFYLSKQMGECQGYPQLYLIDMKTKQVIWHSCGYYKGFTKDIEEIIKNKDENKN